MQKKAYSEQEQKLKGGIGYESDCQNMNFGIRDKLYTYLKRLDYSLEYAVDRLHLITQILNSEEMRSLETYCSSPLFVNRQIKKRNDALCENDPALIGLSLLVDYLVFPKYKNEIQKQNHEIKLRKSKINMNYLSSLEILYEHHSQLENGMSNEQRDNQKNLKHSKRQTIYKVAKKPEVTHSDLQKHQELFEIKSILAHLAAILGIGLPKVEKEAKLQGIIERNGADELRKLKRLYADLNSEILLLKEILCGTIYFRNITRGTTKLNYDQDTGYVKEGGEYILVSENKIDLGNERHVAKLLQHYTELKKITYGAFDNDMLYILYDLDDLIMKAELEGAISDLLHMKLDGYSNRDVSAMLKTKHCIDLTNDRISRLFNHTIPKILSDTYQKEYENWFYTYQAKGTYKTCNTCKKNKLLHERYYYKERKGKDGFKNKCIDCMKFEEKGQKTTHSLFI